MGKTIRRLAAASVAFVAAAGADAGERAWYIGIEGGAELDGHFSADAGTGYAIIATVGHRLGPNFDLEGEIGYRSARDGAFDYDVDQISVMLNGIYNVPLTEQLSFSVGGGLGVDFIHASFNFFVPIEDDSVQLAAQFKTGLSFALSESTELVANYRYVKAFEGDFIELESSTLSVGLKFAL